MDIMKVEMLIQPFNIRIIKLILLLINSILLRTMQGRFIHQVKWDFQLLMELLNLTISTLHP